MTANSGTRTNPLAIPDVLSLGPIGKSRDVAAGPPGGEWRLLRVLSRRLGDPTGEGQLWVVRGDHTVQDGPLCKVFTPSQKI